MDDALEGVFTGLDHITDRYGDQIYDGVNNKYRKTGVGKRRAEKASKKAAQQQRGVAAAAPQSEVSGAATNRYRHRNSLPSPEPDRDAYTTAAADDYANRPRREDSLERESQRSAQVLREYENEADDPRRTPRSALGRDAFVAGTAGAAGATAAQSNAGAGKRDLGRDSKMSYADGGRHGRPRSQPPDGRYYYEDDGYGSDYDERTGQRYKSNGRGYGDGDRYDYRDAEDGEPYREYIETERYRGPAGAFQPRARGSFGAPAPIGPPPVASNAGGYGAAAATGTAIAPYKRGGRSEVSRRSRSRGRRDYSNSRSRSRSRSGSNSGIRGKVDEWFDPSAKGIGIGIAGAVVGGLVGKEFGGVQHRKRDMIIGAVVGGLGANAAENKWREYRHPDERGGRRELAYENDDYGRKSRSSMR